MIRHNLLKAKVILTTGKMPVTMPILTKNETKKVIVKLPARSRVNVSCALMVIYKPLAIIAMNN